MQHLRYFVKRYVSSNLGDKMDHFDSLWAPAKVKITLDKASTSSYLGYELKKVRDERLWRPLPYN